MGDFKILLIIKINKLIKNLKATRMKPSNFLHMFEMSNLEMVGGRERMKMEE